MAGQPPVVVQMRKEAVCIRVDINLAPVMKRVVITGGHRELSIKRVPHPVMGAAATAGA